MTMESIIEKLGFNPLEHEKYRDSEPCGVIDDTGSPYDVLTDEEMNFLATEVIKMINKRKDMCER